MPGKDELTKEFYKTFWDEIKTPLVENINQGFYAKILSISQRQAVIKLNEKKDTNVDTKILSKAMSKILKVVLP